MKTTLVILCVCLFGALQGRAQQQVAKTSAETKSASAAVAASPSSALASVAPEKAEDIRKLLELAGTKARMAQVMAETEKTMRPLMTNAFPEGEYREKLIDAFFEKFHAKLDLQPLYDQAVLAYDRHFSHEEIKEMIQFYQTPVGKKMSQVNPMLTSELMAQGQKFGQDLGRRSMLEVLAEHPDLEKQMEEAHQAAKPR